MKKNLILVVILFLDLNVSYAQDIMEPQQLVNIIKSYVSDIHQILIEERAENIALDRYSNQDTLAPLGIFYLEQFGVELANLNERNYTILPNGAERAE